MTYASMAKMINIGSLYSEKQSPQKAGQLQYLAQECRIEVFNMLRKIGNGHWGGSASSAELLTTLYFHILKTDPENPSFPDRDRLVLSKGHAAPILYTLLAKRGFFPEKELETLRTLNSRLQGHPCMNKTPGVEMSTGPLGHGLSVALGMALSAKLLKKNYWSFALLGDGCLNEGQTWEAIMSTQKFKPPRLSILIDYNKVQLDGASDEIMPLDPLIDKFKAFNLNVSDKIYDGHNVPDIFEAWDWIRQNQEAPSVVIFKTVKGKGVSFMENNHKWHGARIDDESYKVGLPELERELENIEKLINNNN